MQVKLFPSRWTYYRQLNQKTMESLLAPASAHSEQSQSPVGEKGVNPAANETRNKSGHTPSEVGGEPVPVAPAEPLLVDEVEEVVLVEDVLFVDAEDDPDAFEVVVVVDVAVPPLV